MLHAHINLLGHYSFELPPPVAADERRAICLVDHPMRLSAAR